MQVVFIADLHLGHRTIVEHSAGRREGSTVDEHDDWVINQLMSIRPDKRTLWYILGDVAMEESRLTLLDQVPGRKKLVLGNHDLFPTEVYLRHFEQVLGGIKKYGIWLTHMPMHPTELYQNPNVHGHTHCNSVADDPWYLNVAIEWAPNKQPVTLDEVRLYFHSLPLVPTQEAQT